MEFRIADTFTPSLTKLTGQEQKTVKTIAFDLQPNSASVGMRFYKRAKVKEVRFELAKLKNAHSIQGAANA